MAEKKYVIEYIDIIKSFEKVKEKLKNKSDKGHQHGNADITDIDASKIKSGTIDIDRLPKGAIERMVYVKDDAARFALTTNTAQNGDTVKVTSTKKMFYVIDDTKLSSEAGYEPYTAESASAVPWSGVTGKPTTFTPETHTHAISEVADLQETLTGLRQDVNAKPNDNTWRDVVDGLDSARTDASLSANQGRVLNEKIDGIEIGGRNLFLGTKDFSAGTSNVTGIFDLTNKIGAFTVLKAKCPSDRTWYDPFSQKLEFEPNTQYTLSFYAKAESTCIVGSFFYNIGNEGEYKDGLTQTAIGSKWKKYVITWATGDTARLASVIPIRLQDTKDVWVYMYAVKFEKGNKATDWSPAPEDVEADAITKANNALSSAKSYTDTQVSPINTSVNKLQSQLGSHTVNSDVPANAKFTDTWRGIQDNLTSTSTSDSLSANQGRILNGKFGGYLPLHDTADIAASVTDYGDTAKHIQVGFSGAGITGDDIKYIAGYTSGDGGNLSAKIKDISKDALKSWLGLGSRAYDSTSYLPLSGGEMSGDIIFNGYGTSTIGTGSKDGAGLDAKNNLNIASWYGVSFTSKCAGLAYSDKPGVSIDCRNGTLAVAGAIYANGGVVGDLTGNAKTATTANSANSAKYINYSTNKYVTGDSMKTPYWRFATIEVSSDWYDQTAVLLVNSGCIDGGFGIIKLSARSNQLSNTENAYCEFSWLIRRGFDPNQFIVKGYSASKTTNYFDVYYKATGGYQGLTVTVLSSGSRGNISFDWKLTNDDPRAAMDLRKYNYELISSDKGVVYYANTANHLYNTQGDGSKNSMNFYWMGKDGQPTWLWGGTDGSNMYVYNPSNFSVNYANSAGSATSATKSTGVVDYGSTDKTIQIGYSGDGISGDNIKFIAGYTTGNGSNVDAKIKDVSKDALKSWLGLGSLAYSSASIPTSLPASDVYAWAKASSKPSYSWGEISGRPTALSSFTNDSGFITGSDSRLTNARPASDVYSWAKASSKPSYTAGEVGAAAVYDVKEVIPMNSGTSHEIQTDYSSAIIRIGNLCMAMCGITGTIYPRTWYPVAQIPTPNNSKTYFPTKQTNTIICGISGSDHMEAIIDTKGIIKVWWSGSSPVTSANFCIPYYIK